MRKEKIFLSLLLDNRQNAQSEEKKNARRRNETLEKKMKKKNLIC